MSTSFPPAGGAATLRRSVPHSVTQVLAGGGGAEPNQPEPSTGVRCPWPRSFGVLGEPLHLSGLPCDRSGTSLQAPSWGLCTDHSTFSEVTHCFTQMLQRWQTVDPAVTWREMLSSRHATQGHPEVSGTPRPGSQTIPNTSRGKKIIIIITAGGSHM